LGLGSPEYKLDKKELLKTTDRQEYEKQKLQQQHVFSIDWLMMEEPPFSLPLHHVVVNQKLLLIVYLL
jgi:hypothetical protein